MPSSGTQVSYTNTRVIAGFPKSIRVINSAIGAYAPNPGRKGRVIGTMNLDAIGSDASYAIAVLRGATYYPIGPHVSTNEVSPGTALVLDTDIFTMIGESGSTNGTGDFNMTIQETDE